MQLAIEIFHFTVVIIRCWGINLYDCHNEGSFLQADGDEPAGDRATTHDSVHDVFVNKKLNAMFVFVLLATEVELVSFFGRCFIKAFPSHLDESKQIPSVSLHLMCEFFQFSCSSQCPDVPCVDGDVVSSTYLVGRRKEGILSTPTELIQAGEKL